MQMDFQIVCRFVSLAANCETSVLNFSLWYKISRAITAVDSHMDAVIFALRLVITVVVRLIAKEVNYVF